LARRVAPTIPSGHFTVSNSCGQITYQRHMTEQEYIEATDGVVLRLAADGSA
jgi:hypothetical protein